jgi:hypothetical protein
MKEIYVDNIWNAWNKGFCIVIPTNGFVKKNGECVMGRGLALQAKERFPDLPKRLGHRIGEFGNVVFIFREYRLLTFPVKHKKWWEKADLKLIEKSAKELQEIFKYNLCGIPTPVYLPKVGCGNGKRNWTDVKPILEKYLDDRFIVVGTMKIGDIIHPIDAPFLLYKIVGDASPVWDAWYIEPLGKYRGMNTPIDEDEKIESGYGPTPRKKKDDKMMVFKNDIRWVVAE